MDSANTTRRVFLMTGLASGTARAAGSQTPPSRQLGRRRPNILFFLSDQHRGDFLGANQTSGVVTPNLDQVARNGMRFSRALAASPLSGPSRACLASGREYARCGVRNNGQDYPLDIPTFYQSLREAGYHVMGCGKLDLHKASLDWGIDGKRFLPEWGFSDGIDNAGKMDAILSGAREPRDPYMAYLHRRGLAAAHVEDFRRRSGASSYLFTDPTPLPEEAYCDNWLAQNGLALLRGAPAAKPWFLQLGFTGPHNPVDITSRMERNARKRSCLQPVDSEQYSPARHTAIRQNYGAMIENIDRWLGIYLEELRRRGELDNTMIIYSSDHGEMLGDHERWGKSVPYHPSVNVPLYVAGPGVERGVVSDALVSLVDLPATLLDLGAAPRLRDSDSISLRNVLEGKARAHREFLRCGLDRWRMVFDGRYKLIRGFPPGTNGKGGGKSPGGKSPGGKNDPKEARPVLFDLKVDPQERSNRAREAPNQVERLSALLGV
ncbi:MAG: sulfatase-like hydrolase/transferase [Acidobacteria bacterium]|nr:sulfatase-like hydrolase/transferase [Acidobacteriota bacterium]